jgi:polyisoprenoid-binding protein YceI
MGDKTMRTTFAAIGGAILALGLAAPAGAQLPPGVYAGERDYRQAPAGAYALDPSHTAVVAKVSHIGYSLSVFRFDKVAGTLKWDPDHPEASALDVQVETASIDTPVPNFAKELSGDQYLKSAGFPTATFVSTGFHKIDATHGRVTGQFTLIGKTRPMTFDVELEGAGKGFMGHPRLGVEAVGQINPKDFGLPALFSTPIELVIDAEFSRT